MVLESTSRGVIAAATTTCAWVPWLRRMYFAPAFLETVVSGAIRVTLAEGEQQTQDIKLAGG